MKRVFKIFLKILAVLVGLIIIIGVGAYLYVDMHFLNFEGQYQEKQEWSTIEKGGYSFIDRNKNGELDVYEDDRRSIDERADDLLDKMTIEEKIHLLKGSGMRSMVGMNKEGEGVPGAAGTLVPTPRLGLPTLYFADGPAGLRIEPKRKGEDRTYYATAFPIGTLLASTWNTELVEEVGKAMGEEVYEYGIDVLLGPGANIHRHPFNGRNFEYYSEDPVLSGNIGAAMVNGIESQGVGSSVKHFVANNQETNRNYNDVKVSDRAMREIYLKGFEIIVKKSQPWTIMSSYNKVNGVYTSESPDLLTDILRNEWNYKGVVVTDWFGGNNAVAQVKAGNDLLQPGTRSQWNALIDAYREGDLTEAEIDTSVKRILEMILNSTKMKQSNFANNPDLKAHAKITKESATEGMVLLKNDSTTLPLQQGKNVALLGITSFDFIAGGTGSGDVNEAYTISLEEGLNNSGLKVNKTSSEIFEKHKNENKEAFVRPQGLDAMTTPYDPPQINYSKEDLEQIAKSADIGIITIGRNSGEGGDRVEEDDFLLTNEEIQMIKNASDAFHQNSKKLVVVLNVGGVVETASWKEMADGILLAWQGGQEGGNSVASILSGRVNPSGKLPMTFPLKVSDHASNKNFPLNGTPFDPMSMFFKKEPEKWKEVANVDYTDYEEGIYVGYRNFDTKNIKVSFPFGFGLSYTNFSFINQKIERLGDSITVSVEVRNTGERSGKEVVQIYSSKPKSSIDRAKRELRAFRKTRILAPGEVQTISFQIPISDLRFWDEKSSGWKLEPGIYNIEIAMSSRDIKLNESIEL